ncbi:MAG TPA: class I SAM-dependent methyltransferase [Ktedonobacterales bacterium]|nr:class I SAM-dependent methyltransferase [Ktedonobacterales bacterium]
MQDYKNANLALWNEITPVHARSAFYDLDGFKRGKSTLRPFEIEELGVVAGKSLLHLQCHFGMDTLSWARLGASVTGVDFSDVAIALAQSLAEELGLDARFVCSNVYDLSENLSGQFDIVYTGIGAICWLQDLTRWAEIIAQCLKPGGTFYIYEGHPFTAMFENEQGTTTYRVAYPYFQGPEPLRFEPTGDYAEPGFVGTHTSYEWIHSISTIINALLRAGLRIEFLNEFAHCDWQFFPFMRQGADGLWRLPEGYIQLPMMFSLKATKA